MKKKPNLGLLLPYHVRTPYLQEKNQETRKETEEEDIHNDPTTSVPPEEDHRHQKLPPKPSLSLETLTFSLLVLGEKPGVGTHHHKRKPK